MKSAFTFALMMCLTLTSNAAKVNDPMTWGKADSKEFKQMMSDVSKDVKQFFKANPDFIADNFGGPAYNFFQTLNSMRRDMKKATKEAMNYYLDKLGASVSPPSDGIENLCSSPRICQGLQYIVARSIVDHSQGVQNTQFYFGTSPDGGHSYIIGLPKGVQPTNENIKIQGVVIDPWPSQSGDSKKMIFPASDPRYTGGSVDQQPITRQRLIEIYGFDPFTTQPIPPEPDPEPEPTPDPAPTCSLEIYARNPDGTYVYPTTTAVEMVSLALVYRDPTGVVRAASAYAGSTRCDWDINGAAYTAAVLNALPNYASAGYNCIGMYTTPAGTVLDGAAINLNGFQQITCMQ